MAADENKGRGAVVVGRISERRQESAQSVLGGKHLGGLSQAEGYTGTRVCLGLAEAQVGQVTIPRTKEEKPLFQKKGKMNTSDRFKNQTERQLYKDQNDGINF